jgi:hypothetical protein
LAVLPPLMMFCSPTGGPAEILPNARSLLLRSTRPKRAALTPRRRGKARAKCGTPSSFVKRTTPRRGSVRAPRKRRPRIRTVASGAAAVAPLAAPVVNVVMPRWRGWLPLVSSSASERTTYCTLGLSVKEKPREDSLAGMETLP